MNKKFAQAAAFTLLFITICSGVTAQNNSLSERERIVRSAEILQLTMAHNPQLQSAVSEIQRAQEMVQAARGLYPFYLSADTGYTHSSTPLGNSIYHSRDAIVMGAGVTRTFDFGTTAMVRTQGQWGRAEGPRLNSENTATRGSNWELSARFTLIQPLIRGFGLDVGRAVLRQAEREKTLAEKSLNNQASSMAVAALDTFWNLWLAAGVVEINLRSHSDVQEQLEEVLLRVSSGDAAPVDRIGVQTRLASLQELVIAAESDVSRLQVQLAAQTGMLDEGILLRPDVGELLPDSEETRSLDALIREALEASPSISQAFAAYQAAEEKARTAGESMRQKLDLMGWIEARTLGVNEISPVVTDLDNGKAYSGYVGVTWELPLDNRKKEADRAVARLNVTIAQQHLLAEENRIRADVATAYERMRSAQRRMQTATDTLALAEKQAEAEQERFRMGAAIYTTVRDAQEAVRQAELRITRARIDTVIARNQIDHLTGALLLRLVIAK